MTTAEEALFTQLRRVVREEMRARDEAALTYQEAARRLSCSVKHLRRLVAAGEVVPCRIGSLKRIPALEVQRLVKPRASAAPPVALSGEERRALASYEKAAPRLRGFDGQRELAKLKRLRKGR